MIQETILQELRRNLSQMSDKEFNELMDTFEHEQRDPHVVKFLVADEASDVFYETYNSVETGKQFIWRTSLGDFLAVKVDGGAIVLNKENKFVDAKVYSNCMSFGGGLVTKYDTFDDALANVKKRIG